MVRTRPREYLHELAMLTNAKVLAKHNRRPSRST